MASSDPTIHPTILHRPVGLTIEEASHKMGAHNVTASDIVTGATTSFEGRGIQTWALPVQTQVIIGAVTVVVLMAIVATVLRLLMPRFCWQGDNKPKVPEQFPPDTQVSSVLKHCYTIDSDLSSATSSRSSADSASVDWLDSYSDVISSKSDVPDNRFIYTSINGVMKTSSFGNLRGSTLSLPMFLPSESLSYVYAESAEKLNEELMTTISRKKSFSSLQTNLSSSTGTSSATSESDRSTIESIGSSVYRNKYKEKVNSKENLEKINNILNREKTK